MTAKKSAPPVTTSKHSHEPAEVLGLVDSLTQIAGHGPHEQPHPHPFASEKHDHDRTYAAEDHKHDTVPEHGHDDRHALRKHDHSDLVGHLRGAVRALLTILEAGAVNSEQRKAIHAVRVIIGDAQGNGCAHENVVFEKGDRLICQNPACRQDLTPEASG